MTDHRNSFPIGSSITQAELESAPYDAFDRLRAAEPVTWLPAYGGWFITRRDLALESMRDAATFTVDDPRFTTAAVLGPSMLSLDGSKHGAHREPWAPSFRPSVVRDRMSEVLDDIAHRLISDLSSAAGSAVELRTGLAGPMAVEAILAFLDLDAAVDDVLRWYGSISGAITALTLGEPIGEEANAAVSEIEAAVASSDLRADAVVVLFGAIETVEGMIANALWHLLSTPGAYEAVRDDRSLLRPAIEESLRLEPAASLIDRYATEDVELGGALIRSGDLVTINLLAANRDPAVFDEPHEFRLDRANANQHVTFVQGPHACLGAPLARAETSAALNAVLDQLPNAQLVTEASEPPSGLIFRKPAAITITR